MLRKILCVLTLLSSQAFAVCPDADEGYQGGCMVVEENHEEPNGNQVQIFYQWLGERKPDRETVVFLNGGPGGSLLAYKSMIDNGLIDFQNQYNVLLYDARGIGRSATLRASAEEQVEMSLYMTDDHVEDLSLLIKSVAGKKAILFGHSYGGMLAYAFAVKYPEQVSKMINLNGSADALGMVMQTKKKQDILNSVLTSIPEEQIQAMFSLANAGQLVGSEGQRVEFQSLILNLTMKISTYKGQEFLMKEYLESLIALNKEKIDQLINGNTSETESEIAVASLRDQFDVSEQINMLANSNSICHEFINADVFDRLDVEESYIEYSRQLFDASCGQIFNPAAIDVFDVKDELYKLNMPILIMGGTHDPLVSIESQSRDFQLISEQNSQVTFVRLEKTGHQIFVESPDCFQKYFSDFLSAKVNSKINEFHCAASDVTLTE